MSAVLEGRYRWLLRAYPAAYRRERGDEMLGTLMEGAAPDQRRPSPREAMSLAVRGLQTRAGVHGPRSRRGVLGGAIRLAVLLLLAQATAVSLARTGAVVTRFVTDRELGFFINAVFPLETLLVAAALVLMAAGRYGLGLLAATAGYATTLVIEGFSFNTSVAMLDGAFVYTTRGWSAGWATTTLDMALTDGTLLALPLTALLAIPLLRWRPPAARRPVTWLLAVPVAVVVLPTDYDVTLQLQPWLTVAAMVALLLWATVDARATIAGAVLFLPLVLAPLIYAAWPFVDHSGLPSSHWYRTAAYAAGVVALALIGTIRARQQARV